MDKLKESKITQGFSGKTQHAISNSEKHSLELNNYRFIAFCQMFEDFLLGPEGIYVSSLNPRIFADTTDLMFPIKLCVFVCLQWILKYRYWQLQTFSDLFQRVDLDALCTVEIVQVMKQCMGKVCMEDQFHITATDI